MRRLVVVSVVASLARLSLLAYHRKLESPKPYRQQAHDRNLPYIRRALMASSPKCLAKLGALAKGNPNVVPEQPSLTVGPHHGSVVVDIF